MILDNARLCVRKVGITIRLSVSIILGMSVSETEEKTWWSFDLVEEQLIEMIQLWWRSPGEGRWPFASDGPWHLVDRHVFGPDVDKDAPVKPLPLSIAQIERRDRASAWLAMLPERDRRLVCLALAQYAKGKTQVRWSSIRKALRLDLSSSAMIARYDRAISALCVALNAAESRR